MSALRNQLGNTGGELDDVQDDMPELDDDQYPVNEPYRNDPNAVDQDSGAYSFGTYPAQAGQSLPAQGASQSIPEIPEADSQISVISREASFKGDVTSENSIHVYGKIEGTLTASEDVWIAEGAEVDGTINAQRVIIAGNVGGQINASSRFEALPAGKISADVSSPISVVHEGATINGNFKVGSAETSGDRSGAATVIQRRTRTAS
jgi:cytoskeletal protein CcmA (bactofilin family)